MSNDINIDFSKNWIDMSSEEKFNFLCYLGIPANMLKYDICYLSYYSGIYKKHQIKNIAAC